MLRGRPRRISIYSFQRLIVTSTLSLTSSADSDLEAFSRNLTDGSFTTRQLDRQYKPIIRTNGSSRTELDYYKRDQHTSMTLFIETSMDRTTKGTQPRTVLLSWYFCGLQKVSGWRCRELIEQPKPNAISTSNIHYSSCYEGDPEESPSIASNDS